jgi:hypothetical protein
MFYDDEKTTELELPLKPGMSQAPARQSVADGRPVNVVRVDFARRRTGPRRMESGAREDLRTHVEEWSDRVESYLRRFDLTASWALRIVALLTVLILSLLVL